MLAVHWGLRGGCWQEHLCGLCIWSSCFLIAISEDQVEAADLPRNSCKVTIVTVSPRFKGRKDRPHLSLEGYLLYTEK